MADVDLETRRKAIEKKGYSWKVRKVPANEDHALGHEPSNPLKLQQATGVAERMVRARIRLTPVAAVTPEDAATMSTVNAADASIPAEMDWRTRGIIGPVTDQRRAGPVCRSRQSGWSRRWPRSRSGRATSTSPRRTRISAPRTG
jgi:hypothetical protein